VTWLEVIVLGVVQGLTEFLPISSSAHLRIVSEVFFGRDAGAAFTAVTQLGTEAAVLVYFARDIGHLLLTWFRGFRFPAVRATPGDTEVTVRSQVRQSGTEPVAIEYDLAKNGTQWKVYDVRISGISLVATYRSTFAEEITNRGVDGLIAVLAKKNRS
jgi:hypothetical protein